MKNAFCFIPKYIFSVSHCLRRLLKINLLNNNLKENVKIFLKTDNFVCDNIWSEDFIFYHKTWF